MKLLWWNIEKRNKRDKLLEASRHLLEFCYPGGKWRGYANMKGLLEVIQPFRGIIKNNDWNSY